MPLYLFAAIAISLLPAGPQPETDIVDSIEVNRLFDGEDGRLILTQIIFIDRSEICHWIIAGPSVVVAFDSVTWLDCQTLVRVKSRSGIQFEDRDWDRELHERTRLPKEYRRGLVPLVPRSRILEIWKNH